MTKRWEELSDGSRSVLDRIVTLLGGGFTGEIAIECREGGVRELRETRRVQPKDLEKRP